MPATPKSNEIRLLRVFEAPVATVWEAWTDPKQAAHWYGPRGFTITTHSHDLRTGGSWNYTMHGPDGVDYPNTTQYLEIIPNSKMVYDHGGSADRPPMFRVTVVFTEAGGKTHVDMRMTLPTPEAAESTREIIKKHNGNSTWDRLAEYVQKQTSNSDVFVINRTFDAPIETMFEMWTNPKHVSQWACPAGATMQFIKDDIRPGGTTFYVMTVGNGAKMYGRAEYLEIRKPDHIVYTQQFCDEHENVVRHPMSPTWPETMLTTVKLTEEGPDQTRVTLTWTPYGNPTPAEIQTFIEARAGMTQGWTGSLDKLESELASLGV